MRRFLLFFFTTFLLQLSATEGASGKMIAKNLSINPASQAIRQWERLFKKPKWLYKKFPETEKLTDDELLLLKEYLIKHAADSDHPAAAGI